MPDPAEVAPGVFVFISALYTTTTTVIAGADGGCLVVDPAIQPEDLSDLAAWLGHPGDGAAFRARAAADLAYLYAVEAGAPAADARLAGTWLRQEHAKQVSLARR